MRIGIVAIGIGCLLIGCDRQPSGGGAAATRTGAPVEVAPADPVAATNASAAVDSSAILRQPSSVQVEDKMYEFPPAVLRARVRDGQLTVVLMSDDPKEAIDDNYHGNSFYVEMPLELADVKELPGEVWRFAALTDERVDSPNGLFLDGNRFQLQPSSIQVQFEGQPPMVNVTLSGLFLMFETREETDKPKTVAVMGHIQAALRAE